MPRGAIRVIVIAYGVLLAMIYVAGHPPEWMEAITISTERGRAVTLFGHRLEVRLVIEKETAEVLPRVVRAMDLRTSEEAADLVCASVPTSLHRIGGP